MKVYNPNLSPEIVNELQYLDAYYFQLDKPIPFKDGLTIYPINVKDYEEFLAVSCCLTLNRLESAEGIMTSNLGFLLLKMNDKNNKEEAEKYSKCFIKLCELIFHIKYGVYCVKCGKVYGYYDFLLKTAQKDKEFHCECFKGEEGEQDDFDVNIKYITNPNTKQREIVINGISITPKEFDRLREIVMYQNLPDYKDDSWVDPEVREDQREKQRLLAKKNKAGVATLERKLVCASAKSCYKIDDLYNLTMRKFIILLSAIDDAMNYECTRIGLMTGMVTMKDPIEHWIYKQEDADIYGTATDASSFKNKVSGNPNS